MKNQVTFGHLLSVISIFGIPFLIWMKNVEVRSQQIVRNKQEIIVVKNEIKEERAAREKIERDIQASYNKILDKLHSIELKVENKQDRQ